MPDLELRVFGPDVTDPEHRKLRLAISKAAETEGENGAAVTWVTIYGHRAAIVPEDLVEYARRHGWGRS